MLKEFVILPELTISAIGFSAILFSLSSRSCVKWISCLVVSALFLVMLCILPFNFIASSVYHASFATDFHILCYKLPVVIFLIMTIVMYNRLCKISDADIKIEFIVLLIFSTVGGCIAISARDLLLLFCALELQALTGYAMSAMNNNIKSSEAAVKYFVLGALMSCIGLLGVSFLYGFTGSLKFNVIFEALNGNSVPNIGVVIGIVLMLTNILFKLSAAPLHLWTPDVYEGSPIAAVTYFATSQKISALIVLINIVTLIVGEYKQISVMLIEIVAILSIIIGGLGAIRQNLLKRLMAYSTILNVGYTLIAVSIHNEQAIKAAVIFMITYTVAVFGFFAALVALFGNKADSVSFDDLNGIGVERKTLGAVISILMFSMIGLPPLAGFFGKYYIFYNAIAQHQWLLVGVGLTASVVASFYYLKIVKSIYFVEPTKSQIELIPIDRSLLIMIVTVTCFILFFSIVAVNYL